jgi:hypothetical protein
LEESAHGRKDRRKRAGKRSVPWITLDILWVGGYGEQSTLNIRKICQARGSYTGREQRICEVCLGEIVTTQGCELYPTITPCGIGSRHSSAVFYHGAYIVLTQGDPELCAQQIDLECMMVIPGYGRATLVVYVAEIHPRIGVAAIE